MNQETALYTRIEARCRYFGQCGGCALQDLSYPDQLTLKQERLQRALAPLDRVPPFELAGLDDPWRYRNKAEFTFGASEGRLELGYHAARSYWRVVDLEDCLLLPETALRAVREVLASAQATGLPAYHQKSHEGFFRHLVVRYSRATGKILLNLITTAGSREAVQRLAQDVRARHPDVSSVYWGVTDRLGDSAMPDTLTRLEGDEHLEDQIGPFKLLLHPLSFLQPTIRQAERMYQRVTEQVSASSGGVVWDLYCGLGLVGFYLAGQARTVYGIDSEPSHLDLAKLNASRNGIDRIDFRSGRVESVLQDRRFWLQEAKPDAIVVDPPRSGLHADARSAILGARPKQIAYLSCNVQSLVRDLQVLLAGFPRYRLAHLSAFDMFPQTNHVEVLALLER